MYSKVVIVTSFSFIISIMRFRTKSELLEYLGKDKKNVRYIDRRIAKGEIKFVDGEYEYEDKGVYLEKEVEKLREELKMYKNGYDKAIDDYNNLLEKKSTTSSDGGGVDWDSYQKALDRMKEKDRYIYWLQMEIKKLVDPKGEQDEGDIITALNSDGRYDPHDDKFL